MDGIGRDLAFEDPLDDPYLDQARLAEDSSDEDVNITTGDQLILAASTEDDAASLNVYLYNDELAQLYVHHDVMLPDMPLVVEWIGASPVSLEAGNWCAVGTLGPEIELWNLDIINAANPPVVLTGAADAHPGDMADKKKKKKKKKKKQQQLGEDEADHVVGQLGGHSDAVMGLAWNALQANVLASASADCSVRLWDLQTTQCSAAFCNLHDAKVQAVRWNPKQATVLATGGFDRAARIADIRNVNNALKVNLDSDVETLLWEDERSLIISTEGGEICKFDAAQIDKGPVWKIKAHDKACTGIATTRHLPGLLISCSLDRSLKIWDVRNNTPSVIATRTSVFGPGALFGVQISDATPYVCTIASEGQDLQVFDFKTAVNNKF